jgi:L-ascorbate metabolism protein UlaG (beta-lactamase superfamily)
VLRVAKRFGRYRIEGHRADAGFLAVMKWQFTSRRAAWPSWIENRSYPAPPQRVPGGELLATWIGHSTVLLQTAGLNILTDPFLSLRASPFQWAGPKRVRAASYDAASLPPIDLVLLSHNHYDHMDLPALADIARHHRPRVITPTGNARYIRNAAKELAVSELRWGETVESEGTRIHLTPAFHWSKRYLFGANTALWGAFAVETPGGLIYFAADSGFQDGSTFREIREQLGAPRLSLLPIGAYEPRWFMKPQHMNPDEAAAAHLALDSRTSIAIHHGTIQLTDEAIDAPVTALRHALSRRKIDFDRFLVPDTGETVSIP